MTQRVLMAPPSCVHSKLKIKPHSRPGTPAQLGSETSGGNGRRQTPQLWPSPQQAGAPGSAGGSSSGLREGPLWAGSHGALGKRDGRGAQEGTVQPQGTGPNQSHTETVQPRAGATPASAHCLVPVVRQEDKNLKAVGSPWSTGTALRTPSSWAAASGLLPSAMGTAEEWGDPVWSRPPASSAEPGSPPHLGHGQGEPTRRGVRSWKEGKPASSPRRGKRRGARRGAMLEATGERQALAEELGLPTDPTCLSQPGHDGTQVRMTLSHTHTEGLWLEHAHMHTAPQSAGPTVAEGMCAQHPTR